MGRQGLPFGHVYLFRWFPDFECVGKNIDFQWLENTIGALCGLVINSPAGIRI
jgi:hypothetical protein